MNNEFLLIGIVIISAGLAENYTMLMGAKLTREFEKSCGRKEMRALTILVGAGVYILGLSGVGYSWLWQAAQKAF